MKSYQWFVGPFLIGLIGSICSSLTNSYVPGMVIFIGYLIGYLDHVYSQELD